MGYDKKLYAQMSMTEPTEDGGIWLSSQKLGLRICSHFDIKAAEPGGRRALNKKLAPGLKLLMKGGPEAELFIFIYPKEKRGRADVITCWPNKSTLQEFYSIDKLKQYVEGFLPLDTNAGGAA